MNRKQRRAARGSCRERERQAAADRQTRLVNKLWQQHDETVARGLVTRDRSADELSVEAWFASQERKERS